MEAIRRYDDKGMAKLRAMFDVHVGSKVPADNLIIEAMRRADDQQRAKLQAAFPELWASLAASGGTVMQAPVTVETPVSAPTADEPKIEALTSEADLVAGKDIYDKNCLSCHMQGGAGGIGPNFTDDYWIHGAGMNNVVRIINTGVPAKGMITWKGILSDLQIQQVASYILTLHGTNPPNPKTPQGEKVEYPLN
jgi:mono/diheme cytochrome c family protein